MQKHSPHLTPVQRVLASLAFLLIGILIARSLGL